VDALTWFTEPSRPVPTMVLLIIKSLLFMD